MFCIQSTATTWLLVVAIFKAKYINVLDSILSQTYEIGDKWRDSDTIKNCWIIVRILRDGQ